MLFLGVAFQPRITYTPVSQIAAGKPLPPMNAKKLTPICLRGNDQGGMLNFPIPLFLDLSNQGSLKCGNHPILITINH